MALLEVLILAVVQGIAEFLPISSSGHVVVLSALFGQTGHPINGQLTLNVVLHVGTLAAVLVFFRRRIVRLLGRDRRVIGLLLAGSLPAALVGGVRIVAKGTEFGHLMDALLENALVAGLMFPVTGLMLLWSARRETGQTACRELGYLRALVIGVFQAFAILPGVSRSGATIVAGLGCGLKREEAATFSFLLAIPVIAGAGLHETVELVQERASANSLGLLALGAVVAFLVGLVSLRWLVRWLKQGRLHYFAWWVLVLGPVVIVWQLLSR